MALSGSIVLKNNAAANTTFTENRRNGYRVERLDEATSLQLPSRLVIDHSITKSGGITSNRHLIQVATVEADGAGGTATTVVNLTISIPTNAPGSAAAKNALAYIVSMLQTTGAANATFDDILQNQS